MEHSSGPDPHAGQPVEAAGTQLEHARAAVILLHGRGATARDILTIARELDRPDVAYVAPQAANRTWYPYSFLEPTRRNEPFLTSALARVASLVDEVGAAGVPAERIVLLGFSQGACLALEYAARHARRYGGVVAFTGGLIGADDAPRDYDGSLDGTPVFIGSSDPDPHVPRARVEESARVLGELGGDVTLRLYPGMGHTVNMDEIERARAIVDAAKGGAAA